MGFGRIITVLVVTNYSSKQRQPTGLSSADYVYCAVGIQDLYATNVH